MLTTTEMLTMLHHDVVPALGCTEPVCVALAAADAAHAIGGTIESITLKVSPNIYKNGMSVGIPGFSRVGLQYAVTIGACLKNPEKKLELLSDIDDKIAAAVIQLVEKDAVTVTLAPEAGLYVECMVHTDKGTGHTIIKDAHDNIILTEVNGISQVTGEAKSNAGTNVLNDKLADMKVADIRALAEQIPATDLLFMLDGASMNNDLAHQGLDHEIGIGIAQTLKPELDKGLLGNSLLSNIMLKVITATEGRLEGCPHAVMSSAGSGSKGIVVTIPIYEMAQHFHIDQEHTVRALAFAHMLNTYINTHIGKLSAICSCSMASATAAAAAMTWLMGGSDQQIGWAIRNMTGAITGMICDGGKVGCALKLSAAISAAVTSAILAKKGVVLRDTDGICGTTPENCIHNMGRISNPGMVATDKEILQIMIDKS